MACDPPGVVWGQRQFLRYVHDNVHMPADRSVKIDGCLSSATGRRRGCGTGIARTLVNHTYGKHGDSDDFVRKRQVQEPPRVSRSVATAPPA